MTNSERKVPFGRDANGEWKTAYDVPRGKPCGLTCVACAAQLQSRQGEVNVWHLAHIGDSGGSGGGSVASCAETSEHKFIKDLIYDMTVGRPKHIPLPGMIGYVPHVDSEARGNTWYFLPSQPAKLELDLNIPNKSIHRRFDVALRGQVIQKNLVPTAYRYRSRFPGGFKKGGPDTPLVIEVANSNKKDGAFIADMQKIGVSCLEYDFSSFKAQIQDVDFDSPDGLATYKERIHKWVKNSRKHKHWLVRGDMFYHDPSVNIYEGGYSLTLPL